MAWSDGRVNPMYSDITLDGTVYRGQRSQLDEIYLRSIDIGSDYTQAILVSTGDE